MLLTRWLTRRKRHPRPTNRPRPRRGSPLSWDWLLEDRCLPSGFPSPTPRDPSATYVDYLYEALLGRPADAGAGAWVSQLDSGSSPAVVVQGIVASPEYLGNLVNNLYQQYLHRPGDQTGINNWVGFLQGGGTVEQVAGGLLSSTEYYQLQGGTNSAFVASLYTNLLGRTGSAGEVESWTTAMAGGTTPAQVAGAILTSQEYRSNLVQSYYQIYLGRPADAAGLATWVGQLNQGVTDQEVLASLLGSAEAFGDAGSFVFTDSFGRASGTDLGPNWTTVLGEMGTSGDQAAGLSGVVDQAQVNNYYLTDATVGVLASVGTGNAYAGVFARRDTAGDMYVALLADDSTKSPSNFVELARYTPGLAGTDSGWSILAQQALPTPTTRADLKLQVSTGSTAQTTLQLSVNDALTLSWTEGNAVVSGVSYDPLSGPGGAGLLSIGAGTTFKGFNLSALPPASASFVYADTFGRTNSGSLGGNWATIQGEMGISGDQAAGLSGVVDQAQINSFSLADTAVGVLASVGTGNAYAGVFARRDAAGDMYVALLADDKTRSPSNFVELARYTPGLAGTNSGWSILKTESFPSLTTSAELTLLVTGSGAQTSLLLYVNNAPALSWAEGSTVISGVASHPLNGPGGAGLLSIGAGTRYQAFNLFSLQAPAGSPYVYTDTFDRANATNLGAGWTTLVGEMGVRGDQAAGLSGNVDEAQVNDYYLADTVVSALASVGSGGTCYAGVFARRDPTGDLYAALLVEDSGQNPSEYVELARYTPGLAGTDGGWSLLQSQSLLTPTPSAELTLQVTGSGAQTSLQVYLNQTPILSWTEGNAVISGVALHPLNGPGGAGLLSIGATTAYQDFSLFSPQASIGDSDGNATYVSYLYQTLLGRPIDSGAASWVNLLNAGASPATVVQDIVSGPEYLGDVVNRIYEQDLHRSADPVGLSNWVAFLQHGGTIEQVISGIVSSAEYYNLVGGTNSAFVASLYTSLLNRAGGSGEVTAWVNAMAAGTTPAQVANAILGSPEYRGDLVQSYYQDYLGRPAGSVDLANWLNAFNQGLADQVVLASILGSPESFTKNA